MKNDMTQGSIAGALTAFTVPLILSGVFQQLFNWVDAFIVGNVEGELALAGIGAVTSTYATFVMVIVGFTSGLSVLAAQRFGMGRGEELGYILTSFSLILGGLFLVVCSLGAVFVEEILIFLDTPENIFQNAEDYLRIMFMGIPFLAVYNTCCAVLRGLGDSKAPFRSVMVCCVINVFLDLIFIAGLRWGTAGAAVATVLSQLAMTVYIVCYAARRYPFLRPKRSMLRRDTAGEGTRFGIPPAIQSGASSFGNIVLQRFMNGFGDQTVAAITTAYRVDSVLLLPIVNFGSGVATMVAQNIGAGRPERAKKALKIGAAMIAGVSLLLTLLILLAGGPLIAMFGLTPESVEIGRQFFIRLASFYVVYGLAMAVRGYLEGLGDMTFSGMAGVAALLVRIAASYAFAGVFGRMVIAYAEAFSWMVLLGLYLLRCAWKGRGAAGVK